MSIQLYVGHTGQRLHIDPSSINSTDALKLWIEDHAGIASKSQILLTAQGRQVRAQNLLIETELFVFDSRLFSGTASLSRVNSDQDAGIHTYQPNDPPDTISDQNDLNSWQHLFSQRRSWASSVLTGCSKLADQADIYLDEESAIARCVSVAVASLQHHLKSGEKKYATVKTWAGEVLQEQETHIRGYEENLVSLKDIPARGDFARFVQSKTVVSKRLSQVNNVKTLYDLIDATNIRKAAAEAGEISTGLSERLASLHSKLVAVSKDSADLVGATNAFKLSSNKSSQDDESEPVQLRKEIELIVRKMSSDLDHVNSLPRTSQSISQASKMALLHTRNYLPNLSEYCNEMNVSIQQSYDRKKRATARALEYMSTLSSIESRLADLYSETTSFTLTEEHHQDITSLAIIPRLPTVYGQLLVESVRRREWVEKMKRDSSVLQEEMATYQDEEEKRRRKWMRSVEDVVSSDAVESTRALGIELSLQNEGGSWPTVSRQELSDYLQALVRVYTQSSHIDDMDMAIKDLDRPTRKQIKRAKAFKNGSMHETAFGDTSLMLRGEEQHKAMKEVNSRLEDDLKASKSRVRKLEDLLHRSTQAARPTDIFAPHSMGDRRITPPHFPSSQLSGEMSPSSSNRQRRLSSNLGIEEKKLARRIVDLEAELQTFREEAHSRKNSDAEAKKRIDEANSTKKDLMENMEAQQREFASERRNLEVELREAKDKLEEVESEIERLVGSRDDERTGITARLISMDEEMTRLKEDASGHAARAATEQDARNAVEKKLKAADSARLSAEERIQSLRLEQELTREAQNDQIERLAGIHTQLAPQDPVPNTIPGLSIALEELTRKSTSHLKDLADAIAFAQSENESLRATVEAQKQELVTMNEKNVNVENEGRRTRERLAAEEAKASSLANQVEESEAHLKDLRNKFADGETGSDVLRHRVAEEEARAGRLSSQLAEANSLMNSLDVELMRLQKSQKQMQTALDATTDRLESRGQRAKDVSHKLYANNARLTRLLERLGLAITYQDDVMTIERASKLGASTTMTDIHSSLSRTTSRTSPPPISKSTNEDSADLSMLRWSSSQSAEDENMQYDSFMSHLSHFNIDTFADAVVKRVRDFEYTAKKYNREAKDATKRADAYKERSSRLRSENQAKLAVKDFKEGDLALFLPTRGQAKGAWAAFNIGCPHYFLAEKEGMRLASRDFIVARIGKVEQKVVDLSKTLSSTGAEGRSLDERSEEPAADDDNPFDLSDGLTWWMVHASEERGAGAAPTTPGLGKSTVAAANVDARGSIRIKRNSKGDDASKHLNKSLDSRRSSSNSKRSVAGAAVPVLANGAGSPGTQFHHPNADIIAARQRSESQTSALRPPPTSASAHSSGIAGGGIASGLGIVSSTNQLEDTQPLHEQVQRALRPDILRAQSSDATPDKRDERSESPSKSIRSLRRHLSPSPTRKTPTKGGWDNLFSADFTLQSPTKEDKS